MQDKKDYYEIVLNNAVADNAKINVEAKDGILTISVNAQKEIEQNTTNGIVKSFSTSSFMQSFTLPADANSEDITYEVKDGKIIVKIPKKS
ncbi:MAG: Hsp20/alpha crystallin family protein [Epsilonproteobacteria bacterium]|nr:Hsp20/alpha crystallin family protein [Campylobacterota bacterium]